MRTGLLFYQRFQVASRSCYPFLVASRVSYKLTHEIDAISRSRASRVEYWVGQFSLSVFKDALNSDSQSGRGIDRSMLDRALLAI